MKRFVIVGGSGLLGTELRGRWEKAGREVVSPNRQELDLADDVTKWQPPEGGGVAVICAAIADQEKCRRDPEATRRINVEQTLKLAERLIEHGFFTVFLSTNLVFDGGAPAPDVDERFSPMTEYGRQKAATEEGLARFGERRAMVRLTKVVHQKLAVFLKWSGALERGEVIRPFSDYVCSPISLEFAANGIVKVAEMERSGTWHLSAQDNLAYSEMAFELARRSGYSESLIRPTKAPDGLLEHLPQFASLGGKSTEAAIGLKMPLARESFEFARARDL